MDKRHQRFLGNRSHTTYVGPCRFISPIFEKLSEENPDITFVSVDVDEASVSSLLWEIGRTCTDKCVPMQDISQDVGIKAMPTFFFYSDGEKVDELVGADGKGLAARIEKLKSF